MGISELAVILTSLVWHRRISKWSRFGESAVDMGFERGLVVDCATGRSMSDEEQMQKAEQRVRDEYSAP